MINSLVTYSLQTMGQRHVSLTILVKHDLDETSREFKLKLIYALIHSTMVDDDTIIYDDNGDEVDEVYEIEDVDDVTIWTYNQGVGFVLKSVKTVTDEELENITSLMELDVIEIK